MPRQTGWIGRALLAPSFAAAEEASASPERDFSGPRIVISILLALAILYGLFLLLYFLLRGSYRALRRMERLEELSRRERQERQEKQESPKSVSPSGEGGGEAAPPAGGRGRRRKPRKKEPKGTGRR